MGTKLLIKNADFSGCAVDERSLLYRVLPATGSVDVRYGSATFGNVNTGGTTNLHAPSASAVFVPLGGSVLFKGLKSLDDLKVLYIDGVLYTSASPSHSTASHALHGDTNNTSDFYTLNSNGDNEFVWKNEIGDGYVMFGFRGFKGSDTSVDIDADDFELYCSVDLS